MGYRAAYTRWQNDPEGYWLEAAQAIDWDVAPTQALFDRGNHLYEWFADARVNTCYNAVDRHVVAGNGDQTAIIYDSPITGRKSRTSFAELQQQVARFAGGLAARASPGRPRHHLYAHGPRGAGCDAGLCTSGRDPFGRVRWLCCERTRRAHRRLRAQGDHRGILRVGAKPRGEIQTPLGRGHRTGPSQA